MGDWCSVILEGQIAVLGLAGSQQKKGLVQKVGLGSHEGSKKKTEAWQ